MGLFSWFKKKKKKQTRKVEEIRQAGLSGNVEDAAVRRAFYNECSELIDEAVLQSEQARNEYGLVTTYLSDVQKMKILCNELDNLPDLWKKEIVKGGFMSKDKEMYICSCGAKVNIEDKYCDRCSSNIKGLTHKGEEKITSFKKRIAILEQLL